MAEIKEAHRVPVIRSLKEDMMKISSCAALCAASILFGLPAWAQTADQKPSVDPVVATVNGVQILRSDIDVARGQLPEQYRNLPMDQVYQPLLNQLIRTKILSAEARSDKLHETEVYKKRIALIEDRLLEEALLEKMIEDKITDDALRARYKETIGNFPTAEEVRARHILVKTQAEADAIIKDLAGGADFAKLAAEKSIGPSKTRGGDLDYFGKGQMVPPFEKAAFALTKGEFTKTAVKSPFGWHVILVEDKRQSKPPSFEESRAKIGQELSQKIATEMVKELTEKAKIERFDADGAAPRLRRIQPAPPGR